MKETIVLIHGYGFDKRIWSPIELAFNSFNIIYLSLPGFGNATVEESYSIGALANRYWLDLEFLKGAPVHLVGHSMGGYVCMEMISQHPELVTSLCMVHSHVFADSDESKQKRQVALDEIKNDGCEKLVNRIIPSFFNDSNPDTLIAQRLISRGLGYNDKAWYYGMEAMRDRDDHSETLRGLKVPVLMIMGEKDLAVPIELAYHQASLTNHVKLCVYPNSRHMAMYDNTAEMIFDLASFYDHII